MSQEQPLEENVCLRGEDAVFKDRLVIEGAPTQSIERRARPDSYIVAMKNFAVKSGARHCSAFGCRISAAR